MASSKKVWRIGRNSFLAELIINDVWDCKIAADSLLFTSAYPVYDSTGRHRHKPRPAVARQRMEPSETQIFHR